MVNKTSEELYLDLMKKTLTFALWPEPRSPNINFDKLNPIMKFFIYSFFRFLRYRKLRLIKQTELVSNQALEKLEGNITYPEYADTMIGIKRLDNIQFCIETVIRDGIEGDLIETGVWRGGACIFMRAVLAAYKVDDRKVYVADSFEGLPKPDTKRYADDLGDELFTKTYFSVSQKDVENNFKKYDLLDDQVVFLKGWFKDTLPNAPIDKLAVLRLDGDMYSSTMDALKNLYPKLSKGGFCIIDDYGCIDKCRKAVDDFREANGITSELQEIDWTGRFWRKG